MPKFNCYAEQSNSVSCLTKTEPDFVIETETLSYQIMLHRHDAVWIVIIILKKYYQVFLIKK